MTDKTTEVRDMFHFQMDFLAQLFNAKAAVERRGSWIYVRVVQSNGNVLFEAHGRGYKNTMQKIGEAQDKFMRGEE